MRKHPPSPKPHVLPLSQNKDNVENDRTSFQKKKEARRRQRWHTADEELAIGHTKEDTLKKKNGAVAVGSIEHNASATADF